MPVYIHIDLEDYLVEKFTLNRDLCEYVIKGSKVLQEIISESVNDVSNIIRQIEKLVMNDFSAKKAINIYLDNKEKMTEFDILTAVHWLLFGFPITKELKSEFFNLLDRRLYDLIRKVTKYRMLKSDAQLKIKDLEEDIYKINYNHADLSEYYIQLYELLDFLNKNTNINTETDLSKEFDNIDFILSEQDVKIKHGILFDSYIKEKTDKSILYNEMILKIFGTLTNYDRFKDFHSRTTLLNNYIKYNKDIEYYTELIDDIDYIIDDHIKYLELLN